VKVNRRNYRVVDIFLEKRRKFIFEFHVGQGKTYSSGMSAIFWTWEKNGNCFESLDFQRFTFTLRSALYFHGVFLERGPPDSPQGFQNISKGNYAEKFSVRNVNALACSLCLW
jgi:hypothetical protein